VTFLIDQTVTWIHVPKPTLDLVGLVLGSLALAAVAAVVALVLGCGMGLVLIAYRRRREGRPGPAHLGLLETPHP
jgi:ABC-type spermidine/putrescine transport system permease subunit II